MALFGSKVNMNNADSLWEAFFNTAIKNDWKKALEYATQLTRVDKDNPQAFLKAGDVSQRLGNKAEALERYRVAAAIMEEAAEYNKALAVYKQILRLEPDNANAKERVKVLLDFIKQGGAAAAQAGGDEEGVPAPDMAEAETPEAHAPKPYSAMEQQDEEASPEAPEVTQEEMPAPEISAPAAPKRPAPPPKPAAAPKPTNLKEAFNRHPIFSVLSDDEIKTMSKKAKHVSFKNGETVIAEDTAGDSIYIIKKGRAEVTSSVMGQTMKLASLGGLAFFGEGGFLTGAPRSATVKATSDLDLMEIERPLMSEMVSGNPKLLGRLIEMLRHRTGQEG